MYWYAYNSVIVFYSRIGSKEIDWSKHKSNALKCESESVKRTTTQR